MHQVSPKPRYQLIKVTVKDLELSVVNLFLFTVKN